MAKTESNPNNHCRELVKYVTAYLPKGRPRSYETVLGGHGLHMVGTQELTFVCSCVHESAPAQQKPAALAGQTEGRHRRKKGGMFLLEIF